MMPFPTLCIKAPEIPTLCKETLAILPPGAPKAPEVFLHKAGSFFANVGGESQDPQKFFWHRVDKAPFGPRPEFFIRVLTVVVPCAGRHDGP